LKFFGGNGLIFLDVNEDRDKAEEEEGDEESVVSSIST
jgi:hypothetical protein